MKILTPNLPRGKQELNEDIRRSEQILKTPQRAGKYASGMALTQPKADGVFISITSDNSGRVILLSKDQNLINLESGFQRQLAEFMSPLVQIAYFEAELQPVISHWSHGNKQILAGNLYNGKSLSFPIELVLHEAVPFGDIRGQTQTKALERFNWLKDIVTRRQSEFPFASVSVIDGELLPLTEVQRRFEQGWREGRAQNRLIWKGQPYEGLVIKDPDSIYTSGRATNFKLKPFFSIDAEVLRTEANNTKQGHTTYKCWVRDTKNLTQEFSVFTGISPEDFTQIKEHMDQGTRVVVEIELLGVNPNITHANPTFKGIRWDKMDMPGPNGPREENPDLSVALA